MVDTTALCEYEKENDVLYIYKPGNIKFTISINENTKLDVDKYGKIIAMEIIDASEILSTEKTVLENIKKSNLIITYDPPWVMIKMMLLSESNIHTSQVIQIPYNQKMVLTSTA